MMSMPHTFAAAMVSFLLAGVAAGTNEEGLKFLVGKAKEEGVVSLPSGLLYKVLKKGEGQHHPTADSPCDCHYRGTLIDGNEFDSSYKRGKPTTFAPKQVIKGWTEAMQMMVEGDKWELYIPSELAYGDRGSPPKIPGGSVLIFTIEILKIKGDKVPASRCDPATKDKCSEKEIKWLTKIEAKFGGDAEKLQKEQTRLKGMSGNSMKDSLKSWINKRITLLGKMLASSGKDEL